jgi:DNA-directed RNA polymerase subunit RPC12/RpoP
MALARCYIRIPRLRREERMTEPNDAASTQVRHFERSCAYCGARYAVTVPRASESAVLRDYHCPECGRGEEVHSLLPPLVRLLSPRTDGKSDSYQETIF